MDRPVPPIISEYIKNMLTSNLPKHIKQNYCDLLRNIVDVSSEAIKKFDNTKKIKAK